MTIRLVVEPPSYPQEPVVTLTQHQATIQELIDKVMDEPPGGGLCDADRQLIGWLANGLLECSGPGGIPVQAVLIAYEDGGGLPEDPRLQHDPERREAVRDRGRQEEVLRWLSALVEQGRLALVAAARKTPRLLDRLKTYDALDRAVSRAARCKLVLARCIRPEKDPDHPDLDDPHEHWAWVNEHRNRWRRWRRGDTKHPEAKPDAYYQEPGVGAFLAIHCKDHEDAAKAAKARRYRKRKKKDNAAKLPEHRSR